MGRAARGLGEAALSDRVGSRCGSLSLRLTVTVYQKLSAHHRPRLQSEVTLEPVAVRKEYSPRGALAPGEGPCRRELLISQSFAFIMSESQGGSDHQVDVGSGVLNSLCLSFPSLGSPQQGCVHPEVG